MENYQLLKVYTEYDVDTIQVYFLKNKQNNIFIQKQYVDFIENES